MNAYGIAASPKAAMPATGAAGAPVTGAAGKDGAAGVFAGTLLHVMEGSSTASGTAIAVSGISAGLLSLLGLFSHETAPDAASSELMKLISGLMEQLGSLENGREIPADLQNQLAALLMLVQSLLNSSGTVAADPYHQQAANDPAVLPEAAAPKGGQTLTTELQQALKQLMDKLMHGEVSKTQASALTEPAAQALTALQQLTAGQQAKGKPPVPGTFAAAEDDKASPAPKNTQAVVPVSQQAASQTEIRVQTRPTVAPLHQPNWTHEGTTAGIESETGMPAALKPAAAAETAETSASGAPAPVWTLLKGGPTVVPAAGTFNAPSPAPVPVQQFAEEMGKFLVKQFILTQGNGVSEARISLHPEHLGHVDIKIVIQNGLLTAQFVTDNGAAREMLETQMAQLRSALQGQGLQVERMEVVQQQSSPTPPSFLGSHQGQHGTGHNGGGAKRGNRGGYEDSAGFEAELDRTAFLRDIGYGSALNVTA